MAEDSIICPYCGAELSVPQEAESWRCERCGKQVGAEAQRAYARGCESYSEAQEMGLPSINPYRRTTFMEPRQMEALLIYQQAFSSLEVALADDLTAEQRTSAVEMMVDMANLFLRIGMISGVEANYWGKVLTEQNAIRECQELEDLLASGSGWFFSRWRRRTRYNQLVRALARLDEQIRELEEIIGFVEIPHSRSPRA